MSIIALPDLNLNYALNVSRGFITGAQGFNGYGKRVTAGAESNILWPDGAFIYPAAAGVQMSIVSTSANDTAGGTGARTIDIHYLDANLNPLVENITMNGVTPVLSVATNIRFIQCMHLVTFGTGVAAAGTITASNAGNIHSQISVGERRCSSSVRMVPAGKRLIVTTFYGGSISGAAAASTQIFLATPTFDGHDFTSSSFFMPVAAAAFQDGSGGISIPCPLTFTAGQSVGMTFITDKTATIVGSWFGWLENA